MKVLSLHSMGHDTGVGYFDDGRLVTAVETERLTRVKHDHRAELALRYVLDQPGVDARDIDLITVSTPVRDRLLRLPDLDRAMAAVTAGAPHYRTTSELLGRRLPCVVVTHEVSHAALAAHHAGYPEGGLVLVNEGRGQVTRSSLFRVEQDQLVWLERDPLPWFGTGFGWTGLGYLFGFGEGPGVAGKVMAVGGYGRPDERVRELLAGLDPRISRDQTRAAEVGRWLAGTPWFSGGFQPMADVVATMQQMFTESVYQLLARYAGAPARATVALGGGCALNIVANAELRQRLGRDIAIPPACGDAGHLAGAAVYAYQFLLGQRPEPVSVYANGAAEPVERIAGTLRQAGLGPVPYDPRVVATTLAAGGVVALADGPAELGPRALGNRSLLGDPTVPGMRKRMSEQLKQREWFRPLGAVIRADRFRSLLPGALPSPHMLFNFDIPEGWIDQARHVDGTSRLQTVEPHQHRRLYELLGEFERLTGVPALINTSLNGPGQAIALTTADVLADFRARDVDLFVCGDLMAHPPTRTERSQAA